MKRRVLLAWWLGSEVRTMVRGEGQAPVRSAMVVGPLEQALDYAPTGLAVLTGDGCIRWANRRLCRMLRRDADDLIGLPLSTLTDRDDSADGEISADQLEIGQMRDRGRLRFLRSDGTAVWGGLALSRLPDEGAAPVMVAQVSDLSALMRAEEQLGMVVQGLDDGIVTFDPRGRVASSNPAATRLLGIAATELLGEVRHPDWEMIDEDGEPVAPDARPEAAVARTGEPTHQSMGVPVDDGTVRWLEVSAHPIERPNGERWVVASYRDVSEHRRVEAELAVSIAADRAKSEFLSRMSHELRTPLNVVLGYAQLLQMDELAPSHRDSVDQILTAGRHLLELVEEVLDLERIERGRLEVVLQPVPVLEALREAIELVQPLAEANDVVVEMRAETEAESMAVADAVRLRQVLLNLLTNAIKYNRAGGRVTLAGREIAGMIVVRVQDTGRGIASDQLTRIFLPFERLEADALGIDGAGVGLALSKRLVEAMGGQIGVDSTLGVGSTFWFVVRASTAARPDPIPAPVVEPLSPSAAAELARRADGPTRRLLSIEDNTASRTLLEQLVAHHGGFDVVAAGTVAEGLELVRRIDFDAVVVDLQLPDGSGEDVVRALRADPRTEATAVIVLTADATPARRDALLDMGADAYLTKPLDAAELFVTLDAIGRSRG
jgi:PAS domain S-box-containing protein